ncbi:tripartite tricarboxylate transporter TctB family protein [Taklimakanibacter lacteus]|uniref:tripartite tricarboxylate transporter TctB family protein n=1 Tax=Taklimakanibacter lacteus TaxID=2268456 RepID=UPI0013C527B5
MMRLLRHPEVLAGLLFIILGSAFLAVSAGYEAGTAREMGPGYFPRLLSIVVIVLGLAQIIHATAKSQGREAAGRLNFHWRPALLVLGGMALFALMLNSLGLILATLALVVAAGLAVPGRRLEIAITAVVLAAFSALVFVKALGVQMPLWPEGF